jgi:hypothetical protein
VKTRHSSFQALRNSNIPSLTPSFYRSEIEEIFKKILQEAQKHGIVYDEQEKVFRVRKPERVIFSLRE